MYVISGIYLVKKKFNCLITQNSLYCQSHGRDSVHLDMVGEELQKWKVSVRMKLEVTERAVIVGVRPEAQRFTQGGPKKRECPVNCICCEENTLLSVFRG